MIFSKKMANFKITKMSRKTLLPRRKEERIDEASHNLGNLTDKMDEKLTELQDLIVRALWAKKEEEKGRDPEEESEDSEESDDDSEEEEGGGAEEEEAGKERLSLLSKELTDLKDDIRQENGKLRNYKISRRNLSPRSKEERIGEVSHNLGNLTDKMDDKLTELQDLIVRALGPKKEEDKGSDSEEEDEHSEESDHDSEEEEGGDAEEGDAVEEERKRLRGLKVLGSNGVMCRFIYR